MVVGCRSTAERMLSIRKSLLEYHYPVEITNGKSVQFIFNSITAGIQLNKENDKSTNNAGPNFV
jgi:hypothetical protein